MRHQSTETFLGDAVRRSVVFVVVAAPMLAVCWLAGTGSPLGGTGFGVYVAVAAFLVACERWLAFDARWGSALGGTWTDLVYVIVATIMDKATFVACVTAIAAAGRSLAGVLHVGLWPTGWPLGVQIVLALLVADVATYVRHRLAHASPFLWRFHRIHHSMTEMYWIRSAYTHPLEQLTILMAIMLPIAFLGAGDEVVAAVAFLFGLSGLVQHANVDARSSVLNYVFATPEVHRIHHGADDRTHSNFSAFFVFMDLLWGTYVAPGRSPAPVRVGLDGEPAFPKDFLSHLALPFRRDADGGDRPWDSRRGVAAANDS